MGGFSRKVRAICLFVACASAPAALADRIETSIKRDGVIVSIRGEKRMRGLAQLEKVSGPAEEIIRILEEAGIARKMRLDGVSYAGRNLDGETIAMAALIVYRVNFKAAESREVQLVTRAGRTVLTLGGEAAAELMDAMSKAGYTVGGGIVGSLVGTSTRSGYVDCHGPRAAKGRKQQATCVIVSSR